MIQIGHYLHQISFDGVQSNMYKLPGTPADHAETQPRQQAAEPGEGEQPYSTQHTEAHHDTTH